MKSHKSSFKFLLFKVILPFFLLIFLTSCSHTKPYYRSDVDLSEQIAVDDQRVKHRLLLIGDAGQPNQNEPVLRTLREWAQRIPQRTTVIFLGDNIYPAGIPETHQEEARWRLSEQIKVVQLSQTKGIFVPGNHDWANSGKDGQNTVKRQEEYVIQKLTYGSFLPKGGCPGPVKVDLEDVRLIVLDTQWWLHKYKVDTSFCAQKDKESVLKKLDEFLRTLGSREAIVVAHHPLDTHGPHGGFYDWQDHIFPSTRWKEWLWIPTPVIGSLYPLVRTYGVKSGQDLFGPKNIAMRKQLTEVLSKNKPLVYAAGHEHSLQVLDGGKAAHYLLVSGLGSSSKATSVGHRDNTLFAHLHPGFMAIDFMEDKKVKLHVVEPGDREIIFSLWLKKNQEETK